MVFSSVDFVVLFLPAFLLASSLIRQRNLVILLFSLVFYSIGEGFFVALMLLSCLFNYASALLISGVKSERLRQGTLVLSISVNLSVLFWFKYVTFFLASLLGQESTSSLLGNVHLPLGISFFTFQALSYVVDVYRRETPAERSLFNVALYISMFPQLVAGPIVRYSSIAKQLKTRRVTSAHVYHGAILFVFGLSQKVLLADPIGEVADTLFADPANLSTSAAWLAGISYSIQIFFDFAGYSNMAIGLGLVMGFNFPQNFNFPYASNSITEFWRRWHISLSSWFRDYLYIPLGGNRLSALKTYRNLLIVFLLCGLWHGAAWTFVFWGAYHGLFLVLERLGLSKILQNLPRVIALAYVLLVVLVGWVFFRAESFHDAVLVLKGMMGLPSDPSPLLSANQFLTLEIVLRASIACLLCTGLMKRLMEPALQLPQYQFSDEFSFTSRHAAMLVLSIGLFLLCAIHILGGSYSPFLYFRF